MTDLNLPVAEALPTLQATLAAGRNAVLVAPPGAGKTTLVPLALLKAPWRADARILMLEPRRLATRAAATRMASLLDQTVGQTVGYRTRIDGAGSAETRIEVMTEGLLLRRLQSDPGLEGVVCVILDEIHERSIESDLGLALCLDLQRMLRPDLRLLAMSATADGARLSGLMDAAVIESAGPAIFPIRATFPMPSRAPSMRLSPAMRATFSPSCRGWRRSVAPRPHWRTVARLSFRCTATSRLGNRTGRSAPRTHAGWCWQLPSPKRR